MLGNKIIKDLFKKILEYLENLIKKENKLYNIKVIIKYGFIKVLNFKIINSIRNYIIPEKNRKNRFIKRLNKKE